MTRLFYAFRAALLGMRQSPFVPAVASLTLAVVLFVLGLARIGADAAAGVLETWGADVEVVLALRGSLAPEAAEALLVKLRSDGAEARWVSADEALARLARDLGEEGKVLARLPKNPLPDTIELRPAAKDRSSAALAALVKRLEQLPEVEAVDYGRDFVETWERFAHAAGRAGAVLLGLVLLATIVVVAAALQLAIYARRDEIEIQKLVGATDAFVKAPFLIEGLLQGLLGAGLAFAGLLAFDRFVGPHLRESLRFMGSLGGGGLQRPRLWLELAAAGMTLGFVGSLVALRRFLRV